MYRESRSLSTSRTLIVLASRGGVSISRVCGEHTRARGVRPPLGRAARERPSAVATRGPAYSPTRVGRLSVSFFRAFIKERETWIARKRRGSAHGGVLFLERRQERAELGAYPTTGRGLRSLFSFFLREWLETGLVAFGKVCYGKPLRTALSSVRLGTLHRLHTSSGNILETLETELQVDKETHSYIYIRKSLGR